MSGIGLSKTIKNLKKTGNALIKVILKRVRLITLPWKSSMCYIFCVGRVAQSVWRLTTGWTVRDRIDCASSFKLSPHRGVVR